MREDTYSIPTLDRTEVENTFVTHAEAPIKIDQVSQRWRRLRRYWERRIWGRGRRGHSGLDTQPSPITIAGVEHARDKRLDTIQNLGELALNS